MFSTAGSSRKHSTRSSTSELTTSSPLDLDLIYTQNMAENTLALLRYLSAEGSPIPTLTTYTRPTTVFYSYLGHFFIYSFKTAKIIYTFLFFVTISFVISTYKNPIPGGSLWSGQMQGVSAVIAGLIGTLLVPNAVAILLRYVLGKGMSWFPNEYSAIVLYAPPALLGAHKTPYSR